MTNTEYTDLYQRIINLPKALLHTHIEGSMQPKTLEKLSKKNKSNLSFDPYSKKIHQLVKPRNWDSFRKIFFETCACFKDENDFFDALYDYGLSLKVENVLYAEVQFSPWKHISRGVKIDYIAKGFINAIEKLHLEGITIKLICDLVRNQEEKADYIVDWLLELPREHFVALGISGGVNAMPRITYKKYCYTAKNNNFKITAHAGEFEDAFSIKEAVEVLFVDRIGHGVNLVKNVELLDHYINQELHFEFCPSSNFITGLTNKSFSTISELINKGVNFSINSDDELLFNTNLTNEITLLVQKEIININNLPQLQLNTLQNAFIDYKSRDKILEGFNPIIS